MEEEETKNAPEQDKEFKFFFREYVDHETNKKKNQDREERERKRRLEEEQKRREAEKNKQLSLEAQKNKELFAKAQAELARVNKIKLEEESKELAGIVRYYYPERELRSYRSEFTGG
jgi:hemolysin activation/secretion protein